MRYIKRTPQFTVSVVRPNYFSPSGYAETTVAVFQANEANTVLISYDYMQTVGEFDSPFSLTLLPVRIGREEKTAIDLFRLNDLVKIEEFDEVKYLGIIEDIRYAASMGEGGADRTISVTGFGIGGILERFQLVLDFIILSSIDTKNHEATTLEALNYDVITKLNALRDENTSVHELLDGIYRAFRRVMMKIGKFEDNIGIWKVVEEYLGYSDDAKKMKLKYPFAGSLFNYGGNSLLGIWQMLVFRPVNEFFMRWDEKKEKYLVFLRPTPFSPDAWKNLRITTIDPLWVDRCDLGYSSREVKTWFFAYLAGGATPYEIARAMYQDNAIISPANGIISDVDKTRLKKSWSLYGYRPLEVSFKYVNPEKIAKGISLMKSDIPGDVTRKAEEITDKHLMKLYSEQIHFWYKRLDEMASGGITMMTMKGGPRIGERVYFHGAQFYVEAIKGSWSYNDSMQSDLVITRGGVYNESFDETKDESAKNWWFRRLQNVGEKIGTTPEEMVSGGTMR